MKYRQQSLSTLPKKLIDTINVAPIRLDDPWDRPDALSGLVASP